MSPIDTLPKLPPAIARHTLFLLLELLPPPLSDTAEERTARDEHAMASLAVLNPADAFEARLAARAVAADARATECLRLASVPKTHPDRVDQCVRQANAMMRASEAAVRSLRAMQAVREKAEAAAQPALVPVEPPACDIAAEADEFARPSEGCRPDPPARTSAGRPGADVAGLGAGHHRRHQPGPARPRSCWRQGNAQGRLTPRARRGSSVAREPRVCLLIDRSI